jgi:N-methylhydantoinase A
LSDHFNSGQEVLAMQRRVGGGRIGVDVGGTFTDFAFLDDTGQIHSLKLPTNRDTPAVPVLEGTDQLLARLGATSVSAFVHGTTLATNTVIERTGARTGLLVTKGFRDILEIGRLRLPDTTNFDGEKPAPLVPRQLVVEIDERILASGRIYRPLDRDEVRRSVRNLLEHGVDAIGVCFLHAFTNPEHERISVQLIRSEFPGIYVSASHEVWPQQREYERCLVTVMNSYIGKRVSTYLSELQHGLTERHLLSRFHVTRSNGGMMTAEGAIRLPIATLLSGPASGAVGAAFVARAAGFDRVITLDMGGTSADVAVVDREVSYSSENQVGDFPVIMTAVDVSSIGAGGGSIAWVDSGGVLKVGPRSAGSDPGPACYGRGGEMATVTDAYVAVGIIHADRFLGGAMPLVPDLALTAVARIGHALSLSPTLTADSILQVTTAKMYAQLTPLMAHRGIDPRDFALVAFGGAGPTHAFLLAREVGIDRVVVPLTPGVLCALGAAISDIKGDFVKTVYANTSHLTPQELDALFSEVEGRALDWIRTQEPDAADGAYVLVRKADMRFYGQAFEIPVELPRLISSLEQIVRPFLEKYEAVYGQVHADMPVEVVTIYSTVASVTPKPRLTWNTETRRPAGGAVEDRAILLGGDRIKATVYSRDSLMIGTEIVGPAIIEQYDSTTFVPPGFDIVVDAAGNLIGTRDRAG